jgi:hypothetical protein
VREDGGRPIELARCGCFTVEYPFDPALVSSTTAGEASDLNRVDAMLCGISPFPYQAKVGIVVVELCEVSPGLRSGRISEVSHPHTPSCAEES